MTTILRRNQDNDPAWTSMPGWGIVAELTPPEVVAARSLKTLKRAISVAAALVLALCAVGVLMADHSDSSAGENLTAAHETTTALLASQSRYAKVTEIDAAIAAATSQQSSLMSGDVDMSKLVASIAAALPDSVNPTSVTVSLVGSAGASAAPTPAATGTAAAGAVAAVPDATTGSVSMTGSAKEIDDVATFVAALDKTPGFIDVLPSSTSTSAGKKASWTVTFGLTSALYSNRFAATPASNGTQTSGGS